MRSDMIGTWETHGFTLWGLSSIFQNVLPRDSEGNDLMIGRWGLCACVCVCSRTFMIVINYVQRKIALGCGNSSSAQLLYNIIESNGWKGGFQLGTGL